MNAASETLRESGKSLLIKPLESVLPMTEDWITDRLPTEADADKRGEVVAQMPGFKPGDTWSCFLNWKHIITGSPWRHTSMWESEPTPTTTTTIPRKFTRITHSDDRYVALADDGTAWFSFGDKCGWVQLPPLPAREVEA